MENKSSSLFIKWWHTAIIALISAVLYIGVDDNNIVSDGVQRIFYFVFWLSVLATIILAFKRKKS